MDALGNPVHFLLTGGNIFDASVAVDLLSKVKISGSVNVNEYLSQVLANI